MLYAPVMNLQSEELDIKQVVTEWCSTNLHLADSYGAWGMCAIASDQLAAHLMKQGVEVNHIRITGHDYGQREHWALIIEGDEEEGTVIDVTARQFNPAAPFPLIKDLVDWLDDGCEWLVDGLYAAAFPNSSVEDDPLWVEVHIREDIEPGEITYYPQPA